LCPSSSANAIPLTSIAANTTPISRKIGIITSIAGLVSTPRARVPGGRGRGGGSVPRCAARARQPISVSAAAVPSPAAGWTAVASAVTISGPATKIDSSTTDSNENAACSRAGLSRSRCDHRARTQAPSEIWVSPAIAAAGKSVQTGSPSSENRISTVKLAALASTTGTSTRCCPYRSAKRALSGDPTA
jgi:hypothetical protein